MYGINRVMAKLKGMESEDEREVIDNYNFEELTNQCQRYEEQIVELHSVIAELSRKLEVEQDDIIHEETETSGEDFDESNHDSFNYEEYNEDKSPKSSMCNIINGTKNKLHLNKKHEDYNSLVFERDLDSQSVEIVELDKDDNGQVIDVSNCDNVSRNRKNIDTMDVKQQTEEDRNSEILDQVKQELAESRKELEQLKELLTIRDGEKEMLLMDRNSLKRQLDDLQATMEYQDAKMDLRKKPSSRKSSTVSSRLTNDSAKASNGDIEGDITQSRLPLLSNSISIPDMPDSSEEPHSIPKQVQRRRSLRKSKKNQPCNEEKVTYLFLALSKVNLCIRKSRILNVFNKFHV